MSKKIATKKSVEKDHIKQKIPNTQSIRNLVGAGGFGPPKSLTTDLQSAPFGRSGTLP